MKKSIIQYRLYDKDNHANKKLHKKIGLKIKLPAKEVVNFKSLKSWRITGDPTAEFTIGKKQYSFEFTQKGLVVTSYDWIKMNKKGDLVGIKNWKETVIK